MVGLFMVSSNRRGKNRSKRLYPHEKRLMSNRDFTLEDLRFLQWSEQVNAQLTTLLPTKSPPCNDWHTPNGEGDEEVQDEYLPTCFYSQMLSKSLNHRSASEPPTPRSSNEVDGNKTEAERGEAKISSEKIEHDAKRTASRLFTYQRHLQSQKLDKNVAPYMDSHTLSKVTEVAEELSELISYVRRRNEASAVLRSQLALSKIVRAAYSEKVEES